MPSEKMRYILRRTEVKRQMRTDVEITPLKVGIKAIFSPGNIDDDCDRISGLLYPYKVRIRELLDQGEYHEAFTLFYEILESLSYHFVKDVHYCNFDNMYSPDYTGGDMLDAIVRKVKEGVVAESDINIDFAVMKPATADGIVFTHPADFGWSNLGNWQSLHEKLQKDENSNASVGNVQFYESSTG